MAEWKLIYHGIAVVVLFYITYQAYLVSRINLDAASDFQAEKVQYEKQVLDRIELLEKQQSSFEQMIAATYEKIDRIQAIKRRNLEAQKGSIANSEVSNNEQYNKPIPVLMIACNRPTVSRALDSVLAARKKYGSHLFPITVSQDCGHEATLQVIQKYAKDYPDVGYVEQPDRSEPWRVDGQPVKESRNFLGYYKLSRHYNFALTKIFELFPESDGVIIVEDDLEVSPDFFTFFKTLTPLLLDPAENLYCLSAWNDNGKEGQIEPNPKLLHRTDFFGGLGWMLKKSVWTGEWSGQWPDAFWDDWVRHQDRRKERSCIRPEISRTSTFGKVGVSNGQFFDAHLAKIHENKEDVKWSSEEVDSLRRKNYDESFLTRIEAMKILKTPSIPLTKAVSEFSQNESTSEVRIIYSGKKDFERIAKQLAIMSDFKAGVPRCGYYGVVQTQVGSTRVFLTPPDPRSWEYQTAW